MVSSVMPAEIVVEDMDVQEANTSPRLRETAQQARLQANEYRVLAQQLQQSMQMFPGSVTQVDVAMVRSDLQLAEYFEKEAAEKEWLAQCEEDFFDTMKAASRRGRSEAFKVVRDSLREMRLAPFGSPQFEDATKYYWCTRRAIAAFRNSIDPALGAADWIHQQDAWMKQCILQRALNLSMRMQSAQSRWNSANSVSSENNSYTRRCGRCNKEYYFGPGSTGCPQCDGTSYGLRSYLTKDPDHPDEKIRHWY